MLARFPSSSSRMHSMTEHRQWSDIRASLTPPIPRVLVFMHSSLLHHPLGSILPHMCVNEAADGFHICVPIRALRILRRMALALRLVVSILT